MPQTEKKGNPKRKQNKLNRNPHFVLFYPHHSLSLYLSLFLSASISLSACLSVCLSACLSVCLCLSVPASVCLCLSVSVCVALCLSLSVSVCLRIATESCEYVLFDIYFFLIQPTNGFPLPFPLVVFFDPYLFF